MTKFSTFFFALSVASTLVFASPLPESGSTDVSAFDSAFDVDADFVDFEVEDVDEVDEDEDVEVDYSHVNALASREVCNVGAANMAVVDRVYATARVRKVTAKVMLATFETGLQESNFNNLNCGDQDSVGVFQQRPSQGWGSVSQIRNVKYSTNKFLDLAIPYDRANPGYTAGQLAQAVQRSEFPDRYDLRKAAAEDLIRKARARYGGKKPVIKTSKPSKGKGVKAPSNRASGTVTSGCKKYRTVKKGDTCAPLAKAGGISVKTFLKLNKGVHSNCNNLQLNKAYCIKN
ncbi:hypothetical protein EXIGLDRAFT_692800 [Exidia glandulosa HHB12029]|uniref:LysM domain-containing protein n=1 Tax=Exidia glandulosa HHB12029 TaxID=1314781 RepID=A0A165HRD8_EXIGL|nr:hypothetical protein EXIGLDRAFT_692800 [Exidia glandulosa HHB12029]